MFEVEVFDDGEIRVQSCHPGQPVGLFVAVSDLDSLRIYLEELGFDSCVENILDEIKQAELGQSMEFKLNGARIR